jgi:uncharacterized protein YndB with AHSA1/START domain
VRRQVHLFVPAGEVWAFLGDPSRLGEWWPGIENVTMEGRIRVVTTGAGLTFREEILTLDDIERRLQYRISGPLVREHLSTLDVLELGDGTSLVVYAADAEPATMALVIAGAAGSALMALPAHFAGGSTREEL